MIILAIDVLILALICLYLIVYFVFSLLLVSIFDRFLCILPFISIMPNFVVNLTTRWPLVFLKGGLYD